MGSNRPWALALTLPCLLLLAVFVAWWRVDRAGSSLPAWLLQWPGLCLAGFVALLVIQVLPLAPASLSIAPARTMAFALVAVGCAVVFWLVMQLVRSEDDLRTLMLGMVALGVVQAAIAVFLLASQTTLTFLDNEIAPSGVATGTFQNRNHLAAYLNICLSAGIGLLMGRLVAEQSERTWRQVLRDWMELLLSDKARLRLVLVLMVIVVIATRSRMGNASFFAGLLFAASVYAVFARHRRRGLVIFVASLIVVDIVLIGAWVGIDRVVERVSGTHLMRDTDQVASNSSLPELPQPAAGSATGSDKGRRAVHAPGGGKADRAIGRRPYRSGTGSSGHRARQPVAGHRGRHLCAGLHGPCAARPGFVQPCAQ